MSYTPELQLTRELHVMCHPKYSSAEISGKEEEIGETGKCLTSPNLHPFSEVESTA